MSARRLRRSPSPSTERASRGLDADSRDRAVAQSAVTALGAAVEKARDKSNELNRLRRRGQRPGSAGDTGTVVKSVAPDDARVRSDLKSRATS